VDRSRGDPLTRRPARQLQAVDLRNWETADRDIRRGTRGKADV